MKNLPIKFGIIVLITLISLVINMPKNFNLNFSLASFKINREFTKPEVKIGNFIRDMDLKQGLDIQGGSRLTYQADMNQTSESDRASALDSAKKVIESRVNLFGVSEPQIYSSTSQGNYRIVVELPGVTDINEAIGLIGQTAQLDFREYKESSPSSEIILPELANTVSTGVTGKDMKKFDVSFNTQDGSPAVSFETTPEGRDKFAAVTKKLIGKPLMAFLDGQLISLATVQQEIIGNGQISGNFTVKEARNLATYLNAGALPIPLKIVEQRNIGPTLGQESIQKSLVGGVVGLILVAFFMIVYYGRLGFLSTIALLIYGLLTLAIYRLIPITITLPGIAGLILSIGMAVDSNILIFERMKDELRMGKTWRTAMELGFGRAWESIKDANVATIITAFVLYNPGNWDVLNISGPIRGFALTLFLGILISLFTGIFVTRTLMRIFLTEPIPKNNKSPQSIVQR